jgi:hypothetical protein
MKKCGFITAVGYLGATLKLACGSTCRAGRRTARLARMVTKYFWSTICGDGTKKYLFLQENFLLKNIRSCNSFLIEIT